MGHWAEHIITEANWVRQRSDGAKRRDGRVTRGRKAQGGPRDANRMTDDRTAACRHVTLQTPATPHPAPRARDRRTPFGGKPTLAAAPMAGTALPTMENHNELWTRSTQSSPSTTIPAPESCPIPPPPDATPIFQDSPATELFCQALRQGSNDCVATSP